MPTMVRFRKTPRSKCSALQHFRIECSSFSPSFEGVQLAFALRAGSPALRVWLPFRRSLSNPILGSLFQLPTLMGFALQSFAPTRWSRDAFTPLFPFSRFPRKPHEPSIGASTASSHRASRTLRCSPGGWPGAGPTCFLGLFGLSGFPSTGPRKRLLSLPFPPRSSWQVTFPSPATGTPGSILPAAWQFPPKGRQPV